MPYLAVMSVLTLSVRDETTAGDLVGDFELQLTAATLTAAELIRERVHQEVRRYNAHAATGEHRFLGLIQPDDTERELDGTSRRRARLIDADRQTAVALDAFERGQVLLLVDDRQVTEADESMTLRAQSSVVFLRLVPLVGG